MAEVFLTAQVAHIWAQGRQERGRNGAKRVFFEGPFLYSYGYHFLTGYLYPDGAAFLNSDSYSVSTSRHQSDARAATRGRGYPCPDLAGLASILDSSIFRRPIWKGRDGVKRESPYEGGQYIGGIQEYRAATKGEAKAARPDLVQWFEKAREAAPRETIEAALTYAGAKPEEAAKAATRILAKHDRREKEEAAAKVKRAMQEAARDARGAAARPPSDFAAKVEKTRADLKRHCYRGAMERAAADLLEDAKRLFRARKEAKRKGWNQVGAALLLREKILRQGAADLPALEERILRLKSWQERKAAMREGLAALQPGGPILAGGYDWQKRRQAAESLLSAIQTAAADPGGHWLPARAALMGASLPRMAEGLAGVVESLKGAESRAYAGQARESRRKEIQTLRQWKAADQDKAPADLAKAAANVAARYSLKTYLASSPYRPTIPGAYALAGFTGEAFKAIYDKAQERAAAATLEEAAAKVEAWREGGRDIGRLTDSKGGALLRALRIERDESGAITGGILQTSQGADVPLTHAIRAFRFLKLCKEAGKAWRANGKSLAVGHFTIDSIDPEGNFKAGCHRINWGEVESLAARLGIAALAPEDMTA